MDYRCAALQVHFERAGYGRYQLHLSAAYIFTGLIRQLSVRSSNLGTYYSTLRSSYWAGESRSPFPDRQQRAEWYGMDYTCNPPRNRSLLYTQVCTGINHDVHAHSLCAWCHDAQACISEQ